MKRLLEALVKDPDIGSVLAGLQSGLKEQLVSGLAGSSRSVLIAALQAELRRPVVVMTHNMFSAQKLIEDLEEYLPDGELLTYPANESIAMETAVSSPELISQRISTLDRLSSEAFRGVLVVPFAGIRRLLVPKDVFRSARIELAVGDTLPLDDFLQTLTRLGYERVDRVEKQGEMSVRGGIVDVFPAVLEAEGGDALRIEWFDDEIDSIRVFDPADQRSREKLDRAVILPCRELFADEQRLANAARTVSELLEQQMDKMADRMVKDKLKQEIGSELTRLQEGSYFPGIYKYVSLLYPERETLLDYIPKDALLVVEEPNRLLETAKQLESEEAEWTTSLLQEGKTLPHFVLSKSYDALFFHKPFQTIYLSLFLRQIPNVHPQNIVNVLSRSMQQFHGQMNVLKAEIERWQKANSQIVMLAGTQERLDRMRRVMNDYGIEEQIMVKGNLQQGFELPSVRLVVITESEIFSVKHRKTRKVDRKIDNAERIKSYTELKVGDYVVHVNHGIGKFIGIGTIEIDGVHRDYLHILYAGGDKLSVPIDQIDLVQKYVSSDEGKEPKIYKLGGTEWQKTKNKARSAVKDIADELIKLYAARQTAPGYPFSKDTPYQQEFEAMFPYEETPDQLRAIEEIKADMEKRRPMDRLLCGDVGYGKTEVAIRAAFKAAMDGKQVAVLVPTTILAQQHYETFRERFSGFPFQIGLLSRFRSRKEQNETIKGLAAGTVDIVIGTHRLLSNDVKFKDLGLLIVDEEQRFGVTHKEKLKRLKVNVDVLTLTATPIPRTLHMSMLGVRDLSVIETPPENRFPVQTYVVEHSNALVRDAIERELARDGQVYYLFNRVQGIHQMADTIQALVPEARVTVAHGQMSERELEKTILDFLDGEYDVLVSTSIIETGVDIPNVNTLIVHDADKMGLSQLYQLRGRVGRSNRIAYAYFTYQRDKVLNEVAEKRLQAIKEFTELGSGFKIAMRDLAIRGAGNLLGGEQHGFIASVGFDLYSQMLAEEIEKRKLAVDADLSEIEPGKEGARPAARKRVDTLIDLTVDAYLPSEYISDSAQKIEIYKKAAAIRTLEDEQELADELVDRFGDLPQPVQNLLTVARLKVYGAEYGITQVTTKGDDLILTMEEGQNERIDGKKLVALSQSFERKLKVMPGPQIVIHINRNGLSMEETLQMLEKFLQQYADVLIPEDADRTSTSAI